MPGVALRPEQSMEVVSHPRSGVRVGSIEDSFQAQPVALAALACLLSATLQLRRPGKMLPELARRLVVEYCPPGGLVADPMCGIGTTLVEAAALDHRAVGVELDARWVDLARANLTHALPAEQAALAEVRHGDARRLPDLLANVAGQVDLVVTSPPYLCDAG
jgi:tRNA G10  N-methylase Trm11